MNIDSVDLPTSNESQWLVFRAALDTAISNIAECYFRIHRASTTTACRERAYCYELYHQLRKCLPETFSYTLHGEIDKAGHRMVMRHFGKRKRPNPDFIVHKPGESRKNANLVIIEVKRSEEGQKLVNKDIKKIRKFMKHIDYQHGVMLFLAGSARKQSPDWVK
jgi:hypothetical protein